MILPETPSPGCVDETPFNPSLTMGDLVVNGDFQARRAPEFSSINSPDLDGESGDFLRLEGPPQGLVIEIPKTNDAVPLQGWEAHHLPGRKEAFGGFLSVMNLGEDQLCLRQSTPQARAPHGEQRVGFRILDPLETAEVQEEETTFLLEDQNYTEEERALLILPYDESSHSLMNTSGLNSGDLELHSNEKRQAQTKVKYSI